VQRGYKEHEFLNSLTHIDIFIFTLILEYKQSIESNLSDTLGISRPFPTSGPAVCEEVEEGTITPEVTPRARLVTDNIMFSIRLLNFKLLFRSFKIF